MAVGGGNGPWDKDVGLGSQYKDSSASY
jgi:hypothetical protein